MTIYRRPDPVPRASVEPPRRATLTPVRHHSEDLNQRAAREIFMAIAAKHWRLDEPLPKEDQLGRELGVSRTVVREAIKSLASKSIVETRRRRGTEIIDPASWNLIDRDVMQWMSESTSFPSVGEDLICALALSQPSLAEKAAGMSGRKGVLSELVAKMQDMASTDRLEHILTFHLTIAMLAENPFMQYLTRATIDALRAHHFSILIDFASGCTVEQYVDVAVAIRQGNGPGARNLVSQLFSKRMLEVG